MSSRTAFSLAALIGVGAYFTPATVEARPSPAQNKSFHTFVSTRHADPGVSAAAHATAVHTRQGETMSPDLGFGSIPLPLNPRLVATYNRNHRNQGPVPPPIPNSLIANPFSNNANFRRAFALELKREEALLKNSHIAGGIFFTPPFGTPFFPVRPLNTFTYLPVFRVLGLTGTNQQAAASHHTIHTTGHAAAATHHR